MGRKTWSRHQRTRKRTTIDQYFYTGPAGVQDLKERRITFPDVPLRCKVPKEDPKLMWELSGINNSLCDLTMMQDFYVRMRSLPFRERNIQRDRFRIRCGYEGRYPGYAGNNPESFQLPREEEIPFLKADLVEQHRAAIANWRKHHQQAEQKN